MPKNDSVDKALAALAADPSTKTLTVSLNGKPIAIGEHVPKAAAQSAPVISFAAAEPAAKYVVLALDLDAPFQGWRGLSPILHWIQPRLIASSDGRLVSQEPFIANYIGPAPPPGSGPHRYSFYLFTQPAESSGTNSASENAKPMGNLARIRFSMDKWMKTAGVGEPVAINYFTSN